MSIIILGIESSCDDTSAAIVRDGYLLSNTLAIQDVHRHYGGVVPELASRAHQQKIVPVVDYAIAQSGISLRDISAIAFTRGPGLMGSLLVGSSFAKGFALAAGIPIIEVNHLKAHILVHLLKKQDDGTTVPSFPFLCLLVSGGHTQLVLVKSIEDMTILGQTIDDAAGEAFDKCAKVMGLPYPGGPAIDLLAQDGNNQAFMFSKPRIPSFDFSFSGLKTSFLYFIRDRIQENAAFIEQHKADLCASLQSTIIEILVEKTLAAIQHTRVKELAVAGGVAANSALRSSMEQMAAQHNIKLFLPPKNLTTDNAAMIAIAGYFKYLNNDFAPDNIEPLARYAL